MIQRTTVMKEYRKCKKDTTRLQGTMSPVVAVENAMLRPLIEMLRPPIVTSRRWIGTLLQMTAERRSMRSATRHRIVKTRRMTACGLPVIGWTPQAIVSTP